MIVYLVTSGCYSDYLVEGVFSTEEKALEYIEIGREDYSCNGEAHIEAYEVDEWKPRDIFWRVRFDGKSGDLIEARRIEPIEDGGYYRKWSKNRQTGQWIYETVFANRDPSRERAIKSAYERMMTNKAAMRYVSPETWAEVARD